MAAPYLGGHRITQAEWVSPTALLVRFSSSWGTAYQYQLYAGRSLIGRTRATSDRQVIGQLQPTDWPQFLQVVAVEPSQRDTDYGSVLPESRPYNKAKLSITTVGWTDARLLQVAAGTEVEGAVDWDNVIARELFDTNRAYEIITPPMPGTGEWNFGIRGVDDKALDGNAGTALELAATLASQPPDVVFQDDLTRFTVDISSQTLTVGFEVPA